MNNRAESENSVQRSVNVKKNILYSVVLKAAGIALSFFTLPLTLHYLNAVEYGVWITLFSIMNWINMLDLGIGLGLRNKLAEAVAMHDNDSARVYISTGFFSVLGIGVLLLIFIVISVQYIDMQKVFNTTDIDSNELSLAILSTGIFIVIAFVLSIIDQIYYAYQKAAIPGLISVVNGALLLLIIYVLTFQEKHSLICFVCGFGLSILLSKIIFIIAFFYKYMDMIPSFSHLHLCRLKEITNVGLKFFIIQLCCIIGFGFSNILITQLLGPECVRTYDVIFKVFNISVILQNLILTPLWSAYTEAYAKGDYTWIKRAFLKTCRISVLIVFVMVFVALFLDDVLYAWLSMKFVYDKWLIIGMIVYHTLSLFAGDYCMLLNGVGRLNVQMIAWVIAALLIIPFAYIFTIVLMLNIDGVIWSLSISMLILLCALSYDVTMMFRKW